MANPIDKLLQDLRAAKGLAPDPMVPAVQADVVLPGEITAPDVSGAPLDEAMAGIGDVPQVDMAGLIDQAIPAPVAPPTDAGGLATPVMESAGISQTTASDVQGADTLAKYKKYETGTGDILSAEMGAIDQAKNPEATAGLFSAADSDATMAGVVSNQGDIAELTRQQSADELAVREGEAADIAAYQADIETSYQKGLNRIEDVDREVADIASREPDPGRYWSTRTAGQKAAFLLVAALQAFSKPEEVPKVVSMVTKFIDDDVRIQEDRLGRELAAAQGRGRSVRDIISMGKEKDAAIYGQKMLAVQGLEKSLAAKYRGLGAGPAAEAQILAAKQVMDQTKAQYRDMAARGARSNAEVEARRLEAARQRAHDAGMLRMRIQAEKDSEDRAAAAKKAAADAEGTPQVNVAGVSGGIGATGEGVIPNPSVEKAGEKLFKVAEGYQAGAEVIADGMAIMDRVAREGGSPQLDSEWNAWVRRAQPTIARSSGHTGVLTEKDVESSVAGSGYNIIGQDGVLSVEFLRNVKTDPARAMKFLQTLDRTATTKMSAQLKALAHPNQAGVRALSAVDYRDVAASKEASSKQAAKDDLSMTMSGSSRGGGVGYEKSYQAARDIVPFGTAGTPAELQMQAVVKDGRGSAATDDTLSALYSAKDTLAAAEARAKTTAEKVDVGLRMKRADAAIYVIENTPRDMTPAQYAKELRFQADKAKRSEDSRKIGVGGLPYSKAELAALSAAADKYEAALKLSTGTARK